jgi:hypothetical protein
MGPSMASGNQICKPNWVDLLKQPTKKTNKINKKIIKSTKKKHKK